MNKANALLWREMHRDLTAAGRSERTKQSYEEALEQLDAFHGGAVDFAEMDREHVRAYIIDVTEKFSLGTAQNRFRSLRRFFNWAEAEEIIERSPMLRMELPSGETKDVDIPPVEHVRALLATCAGKDFNAVRDTAIIRLFCEPGSPRCAEMAALRVEHVDLKSDVVSLWGKGRVYRSVPFGAKTGKALSRYLRVRANHPLAGSPYVWIGSRGRSLTASGLYQMIERRCAEAGIPRIHPHALRHLAVDQWYEAGGDIQDAMRLFGWRSPQMAYHYARQHAGRRAVNHAREMRVGDQI